MAFTVLPIAGVDLVSLQATMAFQPSALWALKHLVQMVSVMCSHKLARLLQLQQQPALSTPQLS